MMIAPWAVPLAAAAVGAPADGRYVLTNAHVSAEFTRGALVRLTDRASGSVLEVAGAAASITVDGKRSAATGAPASVRATKQEIVWTYRADGRTVRMVHELRPSWRFVAQRVSVDVPAGESWRIDAVDALSCDITPPVTREFRPARQTGALFLRFAGAAPKPAFGAFAALQNPFVDIERQGRHLAMSYKPDMVWKGEWGPFATDRLCIGVYPLTGIEHPARSVAEWRLPPARASGELLDQAESNSLTSCVQAFSLIDPSRSLKVHVPWCENDYQVDVGRAEGRTEYRRIIDQAAAVGCDHMLFTPGNSAVSSLDKNADAWGWENVLFLGLGQKIRTGEWDIDKDPIPESVQNMLDHARSRGIRFVAYAYPTLGWKQNPEWTEWCGGKTGGYVGADTGVRSFQDWFVDLLVRFRKRTGVSGYSFDHWWIAYDPGEGFKPTSKYAQWFGARRILEELRRREPDIVIDGRQQYQWFGPWTWLAGSYPHPTTNDEQPGSFENYPDLHFSRVSGNRQRWAAWWYRVEQFTPLALLPGYMTHQTPRNNAQGQCVRDAAFRTRDWDVLGWKYSVLSSIGTAPMNHVVDLLPARDLDEFKAFTADDRQWLRRWMDWTDRNMGVLRHLRPIIGPPAMGRIDGTAAVKDGRGFIFLFNPNYRAVNAEFALDASIGLTRAGRYALREVYPSDGRLIGRPGTGMWRKGDVVSFPIKGPQAVVLELAPEDDLRLPAVLNAKGRAQVVGERLLLTDVEGQPGTTETISVLLPRGARVSRVWVNGVNNGPADRAADVVRAKVRFAGAAVGHCPDVPLAQGSPGVFRGSLTVPASVFAQLAERRKRWPVPYTPDDLLATWLGSDRLVLYVHLADPDDKWDLALTIDGKPAEVKRAYSDVYPLGRERTFTGFYVDITGISADTKHDLELRLPPDVPTDRLQGVFLENVEAETTRTVLPP